MDEIISGWKKRCITVYKMACILINCFHVITAQHGINMHLGSKKESVTLFVSNFICFHDLAAGCASFWHLCLFHCLPKMVYSSSFPEKHLIVQCSVPPPLCLSHPSIRQSVLFLSVLFIREHFWGQAFSVPC